MQDIIANWLTNILGFLIFFGIYKYYKYRKALPPKHIGDDKALEWIWVDNKPVRRATFNEYKSQSCSGKVLPFSVNNPDNFVK